MKKIKFLAFIIVAVLMSAVVLTSCASGNLKDVTELSGGDFVLKVDGEGVTYDTLRYYAGYYKYNLAGDDETFWEDEKNVEDLTNLVNEAVAYTGAINSLCREYGLVFDENDKIKVDNYVQALKDSFENEEEYLADLERNSLTEDVYRILVKNQLMNDKLSEYISNEGNGIVDSSDEAVINLFKNDLCRAKHVLVMVEDESEREEKLELANEIRDRALSGEDFDYLVGTYGDDTGMESYPDGYYFTYGEMVEEFEKEGLEMKLADNWYDSYGYALRDLSVTGHPLLINNFEDIIENMRYSGIVLKARLMNSGALIF